MARKLAEWSDARTAAIFLRCNVRTLNEEIGKYVERQSGNRFGTPDNARSGGWLYAREDLERVRAIIDAVGCTPVRAAQHLRAIRELGEQACKWIIAREVVANAERDANQLDIDDQLKRRRRRFQ